MGYCFPECWEIARPLLSEKARLRLPFHCHCPASDFELFKQLGETEMITVKNSNTPAEDRCSDCLASPCGCRRVVLVGLRRLVLENFRQACFDE